MNESRIATPSNALDLENRLRLHYRSERMRTMSAEQADPEAKQRLAHLMAEESVHATAGTNARTRKAESTHARPAFQPISHVRFVAAQARFIHPLTWAAQITLLALVLFACFSDAATPSRLLLAASLFGAASAAVGLPSLTASKAHRMTELEYACRFSCQHVMTARLIAVGCANAAALACCCIGMPAIAHASMLDVVTRACTPYFITCAGTLLITRRTRGDSATLLAAAWATCTIAASFMAALAAPQLYDATSTGLWALAAAAAIIWAAREAYLLVSAAARGIDALCPTASPIS